MAEKKILCYCDGACSNNGRENAMAGLAFWMRPIGFSSKRELRTINQVKEDRWRPTSQRAEVMCAIRALKRLRAHSVIEVFSDSKYLIETMRGNMRKKSNLDLWSELENAAALHSVNWIWMPRNSVPELAWCDQMASKAARGEKEDAEEHITKGV